MTSLLAFALPLALGANQQPTSVTGAPLARNPFDVAVTTVGNYATVAATVGTFAFPWNLVRRMGAPSMAFGGWQTSLALICSCARILPRHLQL